MLVAGLLTGNAASPVARTLYGMLAAAIPLVVSEALLAEYESVLVRPALRELHAGTGRRRTKAHEKELLAIARGEID